MNIEQVEARQAEVNEKLDKHLQTLKGKDKEQFLAVREACNILNKADITFYMFPMLKSPVTGLVESVQYNNLSDLVVEVEGKLSTESKEKIMWANSSFIYCFVYLLMEDLWKVRDWNKLLDGLITVCKEYCALRQEKASKLIG